MSKTQYLLGSQTTVLSTGLNSLANNSLAISSEYDNTESATGDGYLLVDIELVVTYGSNPTANTACSIWILQSQDGTNFEDGGASLTPARIPDVVLPLRAVTTEQRIIKRVVLPQGKLKILLKNDGTGQAMASSGNTVKIRPTTYQVV